MNLTYHSEEEIFELVKKFEDKTLSKEAWTHAAHVTVAAVYLTEHSPDEAICFLRSNIISYNLAVGGENTPASGYHETLTLFWAWLTMMWLVKNAEGRDLIEVINDLLADPAMGSDAPKRFYSVELLKSVRSRARWAEPDLQELEFE